MRRDVELLLAEERRVGTFLEHEALREAIKLAEASEKSRIERSWIRRPLSLSAHRPVKSNRCFLRTDDGSRMNPMKRDVRRSTYVHFLDLAESGEYRPTAVSRRHGLESDQNCSTELPPTDNHIMVFSYAVDGDSFIPDKPQIWSIRKIQTRPWWRPFDLHPDGERFAVAASPESETGTQHDKIVFVLNFFEELRRIAPVGKR